MSVKFGRLTIAGDEFKNNKKIYVPCWCECGNMHIARRDHLRSGATKSCGCWHNEAAALNNIKHGHNTRNGETVEYRAWRLMIDRCYRENNRCYVYYGARGIRVCDEWRHDFSAFLKHIGPKPHCDMSIDRIRVNEDYKPGNVRWATRKTQARNTQKKTLISARGLSLTLAEWADHSGIRKGTIWHRLRVAGWSPERAVTP